jgi:hypothetical protein
MLTGSVLSCSWDCKERCHGCRQLFTPDKSIKKNSTASWAIWGCRYAIRKTVIGWRAQTTDEAQLKLAFCRH